MKPRLFSLALAAAAFAAGGPEIGKPAPPLTLEQILQAPASANGKGVAMVLEFWATWCSGCRDQISHLNHLVETFKDRPVRFISITDEEPDVVRRFLKDYPIGGSIGIDLLGKTFAAYNVEGRPQTALIDSAGVLRAIGPPSELTATLLEDFLAGKAVTLGNDRQPRKLQTTPNPFFETMIRPAAPVLVTGNSPGLQTRYGAGIAGWGLTLKRMASLAYGIPEQRIEAPDWCSKDLFDMAVTYPGLTPAGQAMHLRNALDLTFQLKARTESRAMEVYEVRRLQGVQPKLAPSTVTSPSRWGEDGALKYTAVTLASVSGLAERVFKLPAFDETGITGRFDFEIKWDASKPESLLQTFRNQLGLDLVKVRRPLEYLVIDTPVRPSAW